MIFMKRIVIIFTVLLSVLAGCSDLTTLNVDKKNPEVVPGEPLFTNAQKELSDFVNNTNVNINIFKLMAQYWTETTYIDEANYDLVTRNISTGIYTRMYLRVLKDLKESASIIAATDVISTQEAAKQNRLQIIEILTVYSYLQLVDVFGNVPYTEALNIDNVYPKYDDASSIYKDLFARLDAAISKLDDGAGSFDSADLYYSGDVASWAKFANSLKIRMAITIADADNGLAKSAIESAAGKCFSSNGDDCLLPYLSSSPNFNQLYADLVASGRHDFVPANTLVDKLVELGDPRIGAYVVDQIDTSTEEGVEKIAWVGGAYGYPNSYGQCSHIADWIQEPTFPGIMMTYSEICFYLAEAAERGYNVGGTAEEWYNKGIEASFDFWSVDGATAYMAKPEVAYATASGTWKEKIGVQSWLANYTRGLEAYNTWRRLDYPILNIPEDATSYADIPVRFTYPINEQTLNAASYNAASSAIGGDLITTKLFWDKY